MVKNNSLIFEYLPTNISQDIRRLHATCSILPITKILIPANPIAKPYPNSLAIIATLRSMIWQKEDLRHINFIPTIKTNIHTIESLQSAFLTLQYLNIPDVAIISGDRLNQNSLTTYHALEILKNMQRKSHFLEKLNIFCALEANISARNSYGLCKKMQYGVKNFITQPFYIAGKQNTKEKPNHHRVPHFAPNSKIQNFTDFLHFYKCVAQLHSKNNIALSSLNNNLQIYCGFLPLFHTKQANAIHAKKLGIVIPNSYINDIKHNAIHTNISLFNALKYHKLSISYLQFKEFTIFLDSIKYSHNHM